MRGIKTKQSGKWRRVALFYLLVLVLVMLLNSLFNVYEKKKGAEEALVKMGDDLKELGEREKYLEGYLDRLSTKEGVEFEVRKKFNVAEAGESVAIIVEEEVAPNDTEAKETRWQRFRGFWSGLFD